MLALGVALTGALAAAEDPGLDALPATRQRPLFSATRRPPPAPTLPSRDAPEPVTAEVPAPSLELQGVIFGTRRRIAIVRHPQSATTTDISVGSAIDGWTVADIQRRAIVLARDGRAVTIVMPEPGR